MKRLIAPVVVTAILVLYFFGWLLGCFLLPIPFWGKLLGGIIPLALSGVSVYVLIERIQEVRSGEEDDLDNY